MSSTPKQFVEGILVDILSPAITQYVFKVYREVYPSTFEQEIFKRLQNVQGMFSIRKSFKEGKSLESLLDLPKVLRNLMLNNWSVFRSRLGDSVQPYVEIILQQRIKWAHPSEENKLSLSDAQLLAEATIRLLQATQDIEAKRLVEKVDREITETRQSLHDTDSSQSFSPEIREQMARLNKTVEILTQEQYKYIEFLQGHRRAALAGCAGSGKTLVATEKAIRLARAGNKVLILCHNPYLSKHIAELCKGTRVFVFDFRAWLGKLCGHALDFGDAWSHYEEPTSEEIEEATAKVLELQTSEKYDAIIVDEGQDFRQEWWEIIECALIENGILHIFHDDNQSLLSLRKNYPIPESPYILSRNCRNAGEIFDLVARFHPQAPRTDHFLKGQGVVKKTRIREGEDLGQVLESALTHALKNGLDLTQLVVLTTEFDPIERSVLFGKKFQIKDKSAVVGAKSASEIYTIPFYTVSSYKGLEADGIILLVLAPRDNLESYLYVGFSRARFLLNIIMSNSVAQRLVQLQ